MKLLSVNLARSLWFIPTLELNPKGLNLYPVIIPLLLDTYKFKKYPLDKDVFDETAGVKFESGEFTSINGNQIIINLTIFSDGLMVDTRSSTKDSDAFLKEILTRLSETFNLPNYEQIIRRKGYNSQLYVNTNKSIEFLNPKLSEISEYLSNNVEGFDVKYEAGGITFWPDQINANKPINFSFERVLNIPFSENKYFSAAPLETEKHLDLLDKLEPILSK